MKRKLLILLLAFGLLVWFSKSTNTTFEVFNQSSKTYDKTLIIDAGHGGLDGGAVSENGICEADITIEIAYKTADLCSFLGIPYKYTRTDENSLDFDENVTIHENKVRDTKARVELVNSTPNGVLASIHLNSFTDSQYRGAQVFYNETALEFAEILQNTMNNYVDTTSTREVETAPKDVYLTNNVNCPAIIFECGFISNEQDEAMLYDQNYQTKLALALVSSFLNYR